MRARIFLHTRTHSRIVSYQYHTGYQVSINRYLVPIMVRARYNEMSSRWHLRWWTSSALHTAASTTNCCSYVLLIGMLLHTSTYCILLQSWVKPSEADYCWDCSLCAVQQTTVVYIFISCGKNWVVCCLVVTGCFAVVMRKKKSETEKPHCSLYKSSAAYTCRAAAGSSTVAVSRLILITSTQARLSQTSKRPINLYRNIFTPHKKIPAHNCYNMRPCLITWTRRNNWHYIYSVSYTHLTLPTICSV